MDKRVKKLLEDINAAGRTSDPLTRLQAVQESLGSFQAAINEMLGTEFTAFDQKQLVSATVTSRGLKSVDITPHAMRDLDNTQLANACLEAIRNSRLEMGEKMRAEMHNLSDSPIPDGESTGVDVHGILERLKRL